MTGVLQVLRIILVWLGIAYVGHFALDFPLLDSQGFILIWFFSALIGLVVLGIYLKKKRIKLKGKALIIYYGLFLLPILLVITNGFFDKSTPDCHNVLVTGKYISRGSRGGTFYNIVVPSWRPKHQTEKIIHLPYNFYNAITPHISHVQIFTKSGTLGWEWIKSIKILVISPIAKADYNQGITYLNGGKYDQAIAAFNKTIAVNPIEEAYYYRGLAYTEMNDFDHADRDFTEALRINPNYNAALFSLELNSGKIELKKGNFDNADDDFTKIITMDRHNVDPKIYAFYQASAYLNRGAAYQGINHLDEAMDDYNKAIALNPHDPSTFYDLGICYMQKHDVDKALKEYNQAIKVNPKFFPAYIALGNIYANKKDPAQVIINLTQAIKIKPDHAPAYFNRGIAYEKTNAWDLAINDFSKFLSFKPDAGIGYFHRGYDYFRKHDLDQTIANSSKAIEFGGFAWGGYYYRGLAYVIKGNADQLLAEHSKNSNDVALYKKEYHQAFDDLTKAQSLGKDVDPALIEKLKEDSGILILK